MKQKATTTDCEPIVDHGNKCKVSDMNLNAAVEPTKI